MEPSLIALAKQIAAIAAGPIIGLFAWVGKKMHTDIEKTKMDINNLKISHAVQESQLKDIKEDVSQINKKLDKILDRVSQNNGT